MDGYMQCYIIMLDGNILGVFSNIDKAKIWIQNQDYLSRGEKRECMQNIECCEIK